MSFVFAQSLANRCAPHNSNLGSCFLLAGETLEVAVNNLTVTALEGSIVLLHKHSTMRRRIRVSEYLFYC